MSYLVLARRWRPKRFSDLVGQDVVVRTLKNALTGGNLAHAYLLTGIRGVGKTTIARLMAMAVNCANSVEGEPCGECEACRAIQRGSNLDVQEMDAASHTGVDDVREILDTVRYPPSSLKYRAYIIDEAHMLSKNAFNALLKTLEEPPERVLFILATTEAEKLPITVRSRCQRFDLRRLGISEITVYLKHVLDEEKIACEDEAVLEIARAADGSVRDSLSLTERVLAYAPKHISVSDVHQALALVGPEPIRRLAEATFEADAGRALRTLREAMALGHAPRALAVALANLLHELSLIQVDTNLLEYEAGEEHKGWLQHWASERDVFDIDLRYQLVIHAIRDLGFVDDRRGVEMLMLRLSYLDHLRGTSFNSSKGSASLQPPLEPSVANMSPIVSSKKELGEMQSYASPEGKSGSAANSQSLEHNVKGGNDLPFVQHGAPGSICSNWEETVSSYGALKPSVAAMLDHVICVHFGDKVRLGLDAHQQRAISFADRMAFSEWLGREVFWESKDKHGGETLSEVRARRAEAEEIRLKHNAENDPHVQTLVRELDAKLIRVRVAGALDEDSDAAEAEVG